MLMVVSTIFLLLHPKYIFFCFQIFLPGTRGLLRILQTQDLSSRGTLMHVYHLVHRVQSSIRMIIFMSVRPSVSLTRCFNNTRSFMMFA